MVELFFILVVFSFLGLAVFTLTCGRHAETDFHAVLIGIKYTAMMWVILLSAYFLSEERFSWFAVGMATLSIIGALIAHWILSKLGGIGMSKEPLD